MKSGKKTVVLLLLVGGILASAAHASGYEVGAFYYQQGKDAPSRWQDLRGASGSRSPGRPWPDREPLLGYYSAGAPGIAEKHIEWASRYGIRFFAYDWQWDRDRPEQEEALKNHLRAVNGDKLRFCLLWSYPSAKFEQLDQFDAMVSYWIRNYFRRPVYYRIDGRPVVFLFSPGSAELRMRKSGAPIADLLARAQDLAAAAGIGRIYFVLTTNESPHPGLELRLRSLGFDAYTGRSYAEQRGGRVADYDQMVDAYLDSYHAAASSGGLVPYMASVSPGKDARPWSGNDAVVRTDPSPEKFERMLLGARRFLEAPGKGPKVLMIEAWNEFADGSYIEPTRKWGMRYLESIKKVFSQARPD